MSDPTPLPAQAAGAGAAVQWAEPARQRAFEHWLQSLASAHDLDPATVRLASADASFRRYLRVDARGGTLVVMDAPPDKEDCRPFVQVAKLMADAGLLVPRVLAWD